ncbi:MAG: IS5 family transposase [Leptolyngbyaceae cyanobacterium RM2_2_4]|nr:IS5 family transposase [Leptolyngbyaceae cyanobacterium SM1_4_3]NJN89430.1 IS5 family transposase [Leptolyngbyaceae cyanobacterium SL_5_14]NJO48712.1 IS5 family transposase [Leptolyngbyaceae cyanobacterium RM2_2_4]
MKAQYRIRNWSEYNAGLKQRGSLTFWIDESVLEAWLVEDLSSKPGASIFYSDLAITTMATLKAVYHLAGRQCQGFVESIFELMAIDLPVPDHSTLSRRLAGVSIELPVIPKEGARHVVVDSSGVKGYGEGEWKTRQHGVSKRHTWRKLHLGVDEATGEILAAVVTLNHYHDGEVLADVLDGIEEPIERVSTDGAYDHRHCYDEIDAKGAKAVIPPHKDAKVWQHGNRKGKPHQRDENLRYIRKHGRKRWKRDAGYHRRSIAETAMFRFKTIFGGHLSARKFNNQAVELFIKCAALNRMIQIAKPDSDKVKA